MNASQQVARKSAAQSSTPKTQRREKRKTPRGDRVHFRSPIRKRAEESGQVVGRTRRTAQTEVFAKPNSASEKPANEATGRGASRNPWNGMTKLY